MLESFEKLPEEKKARILSTGISAFSQKSYTDVSTDALTRQCQISKGLLFHYFGSKKNFYLYCLEKAMERLTEEGAEASGSDFYDILFDSMNRKLSKCMEYREEMHLVNMASRDASGEIAEEKEGILRKYAVGIQTESKQILQKAMAALPLENINKNSVSLEGLYLYIHAVLNKYLLAYQQTPDQFFENSETIKAEMKQYLDLMLYGIAGREEV